jgi:Asp-tRNA(Asn)/Glu-tRNA(Gln) amidotransferase A subunit family amidase
VASGEVSAVTVVAAHLEAIGRRGSLNAFTLVDAEGALRAAAALDRRLEAAEAVIVARAGLHEFVFGYSSENPW